MASTASAMDGRWQSLLQPIKDLTKNWSVDIASELSEYVDEIEGIAYSFDGGETRLNFAEAALLIQGSTCIYSKKVELLYALCYETLDKLVTQRQVKERKKIDDKEELFENEAELLQLDDLHESNVVTMDEDIDEAGYGCNYDGNDDGDMNGNNDSVLAMRWPKRQLHEDLRRPHTIPRVPISLIPLDDVDKAGDIELLSSKGEGLGNRYDYRMNTASMDIHGALILSGNGGGLDNSQFNASFIRAPDDELLIDGDLTLNFGVDGDGDCRGGGEYYDDGPLLDGSLAPDFSANVADNAMPVESNTGIGFAPSTPSYEVQQRKKLNRCATAVAFDPWMPLDPHVHGLIPDRPLRCGKSFSVPTHLVLAGSKEGESTIAESTLPVRIEGLKRDQKQLPSKALARPTFEEFSYAFWVEQRRRRHIHKRSRVAVMEVLGKREYEAEYQEAPATPSVVGNFSMARDWLGRDNEDDVFRDDEEYIVNNSGDGGFGNSVNGDNWDGAEYYADEYGGSNSTADLSFYPNDTILGSVDNSTLGDITDVETAMTYEDLLRSHVEAYNASAKRYLRTTDLLQRVAEWQDRLKPVLEEQDSHPPFDIGNYCMQIIYRFDDLNISAVDETTNFSAEKRRKCADESISPIIKDSSTELASLVRSESKYETCRNFLAILQLANSGNVDIISEKDNGDHARVRLLTTSRQDLNDYCAPSVAESSNIAEKSE